MFRMSDLQQLQLEYRKELGQLAMTETMFTKLANKYMHGANSNLFSYDVGYIRGMIRDTYAKNREAILAYRKSIGED